MGRRKYFHVHIETSNEVTWRNGQSECEFWSTTASTLGCWIDCVPSSHDDRLNCERQSKDEDFVFDRLAANGTLFETVAALLARAVAA